MHELSIAHEIMEIALAKAGEHKRRRVVSVELVFGELTSVVPDAMLLALKSACQGTAMENARIKISIKKLKAKCGHCGRTFRVRDFNYNCPSCGKGPAITVQGNEMHVKSFTME